MAVEPRRVIDAGKDYLLPLPGWMPWPGDPFRYM